MISVFTWPYPRTQVIAASQYRDKRVPHNRYDKTMGHIEKAASTARTMQAATSNPSYRHRAASVDTDRAQAALRNAPIPSYVLAWAACGLAAFATLYNTLLALINAHAFLASPVLVVGSELFILATGALLLIGSGISRRDAPKLALLFTFVTLALLISVMNNQFFLDPVRNAAIIAIFMALGTRTTSRPIHILIASLGLLVLTVLLLEIFSTPTYVALLEPAKYMQATRGIEQLIWDDSGLFGNALGFESRFSFGLSDHRTASVFLEQVTLANFAGVFTIILAALWQQLRASLRWLMLTSILLIVLTNSTRTTTLFVLFTIIGFFIYPRLPRFGTILVPLGLLIGAFVLIAIFGQSSGDDLIGRIGITTKTLKNMDVGQFFGMKAPLARTMYDTGYGYLITSSSIFGFLALWAFAALALPQRTPAQMRCAYALMIYLFANFLIGGTAVFSMKVSALLWLVVGYLANQSSGSSWTMSAGQAHH